MGHGFFVKCGMGLRRSPLLAAVVGVLLFFLSAYLLRMEGVFFIIGFCVGALSLTSFYIMVRGLV